jgi:hypothetical protein
MIAVIQRNSIHRNYSSHNVIIATNMDIERKTARMKHDAENAVEQSTQVKNAPVPRTTAANVTGNTKHGTNIARRESHESRGSRFSKGKFHKPTAPPDMTDGKLKLESSFK